MSRMACICTIKSMQVKKGASGKVEGHAVLFEVRLCFCEVPLKQHIMYIHYTRHPQYFSDGPPMDCVGISQRWRLLPAT